MTCKPLILYGVTSTWVLLGGFGVWYTRRLARSIADEAERSTADGPMINHEIEISCKQLIAKALQRGTTLTTSNAPLTAQRMIGQVGGMSAHKRPLLSSTDGSFVLKPLQLDHRGVREVAFYEAVQEAATLAEKGGHRDLFSQPTLIARVMLSLARKMNDSCIIACDHRMYHAERNRQAENMLLQKLGNFTPAYFGATTHQTEILGNPSTTKTRPMELPPDFGIGFDSHLLLSDLTAAFQHPCVMDIKMGTQTYEPNAPAEKQAREQIKYPKQEEFGFRLVNMRVYSPSSPEACSQGYMTLSKSYCRSLHTLQEVQGALQLFFGSDNDATISRVLWELRRIEEFFAENKHLCFCASSLLFVREGMSNRKVSDSTVLVKMIDFGRVQRRLGGDGGYLKGLRNLINLLDQMLLEQPYKNGRAML